MSAPSSGHCLYFRCFFFCVLQHVRDFSSVVRQSAHNVSYMLDLIVEHDSQLTSQSHSRDYHAPQHSSCYVNPPESALRDSSQRPSEATPDTMRVSDHRTMSVRWMPRKEAMYVESLGSANGFDDEESRWGVLVSTNLLCLPSAKARPD